MNNTDQSRTELVTILQSAYSGELAASLAYRGHWKSLDDPVEQGSVREIESDEWSHRERVGQMLTELGAAPQKRKELVAWLVGRAAGIGCHLTGWLMPMYLAGRLESSNIIEYEHAVAHASILGLNLFADDLKAMARKECDHERFFIKMVSDHRLTPLVQVVFPWPEANGPVHVIPASAENSG